MLQQPIRIRLQHEIFASASAVQFDTYREFHFIFDDYEIPQDIDDIRVYIQKPSGYAIYNYASLINGEAVFQPTPQTLAESGSCVGQVQIIKNAAILTTFSFKLNIERALINSSNIISSNEFLILDELIKTARIQAIELEELLEVATAQEAERVQAENERKSNETERKQSELQRQENENTRIEDEATRNANEEQRNNNEQQRVESETERKNAENTRISNEKIRVESETTRNNAENIRVSTEEERIKAESERNSRELIRKENEASRVSAEANRVSSETKRIESENSRNSAEQSRISAETKREENTSSAIQDCNTATQAVENVLNNLNQVIGTLINDNSLGTSTTYSSNKIVNLIQNQLACSKTEPTNQLNGGLWFREDS